MHRSEEDHALRFTRRDILVTASALSVAAAMPRIADAQSASPEAEAPWTLTDDKGVTVTLPSRPARIVADVNAAAPLWDFGIRPVAVFGWNANETGDFGPAGGNIDPTTVAVVGNSVETIQLEKTIATDPDLIVTITWTPDDPTEYWSIDAAVVDQVKSIAPLVAISATGSADVNTLRFAVLAVALGADLESDALKTAKTAYETAIAEFPETVTAKSDLVALFLYAAAGEPLYIASAGDWADLTLYKNLGLTIVQPNIEPGAFWEEISPEEANKYQADIIFYSSRLGTMSVEEMAAHPTIGQLPAVKAGQLAPWNQDFIMSFQGMTAALTSIATPISKATKLI